MSYEAKYGWNRQSWRIIGLALVFCAAALLPGMWLWLRVLDVVFFGGGAVAIAVFSLRAPVAVRADAQGITLCSSPMYPRSTTRLFPWPDVTSVVIWRGAFSGRVNKLEFVGVERRPGAAPLTGKFVGRSSMSAAALDSPGVPAQVAVTRAATNGWVLDHARLTAAVAHFAPAVRVIDTTSDPQRGRR